MDVKIAAARRAGQANATSLTIHYPTLCVFINSSGSRFVSMHGFSVDC